MLTNSKWQSYLHYHRALCLLDWIFAHALHRLYALEQPVHSPFAEEANSICGVPAGMDKRDQGFNSLVDAYPFLHAVVSQLCFEP